MSAGYLFQKDMRILAKGMPLLFKPKLLLKTNFVIFLKQMMPVK